MTDHLISLDDLAAYLSVSRSTARRLTRQAGFPARFKVAPRCFRWRHAEVERWLDSRAEVPVVVPAVVAPELLVSKPRGPRRKAA